MDRTRSRRWCLGTGTALALAGMVVVGSGSNASAFRSRTALARCTTAQLVVWLNTLSNGAAGSRYYDLEFSNLGPSCTLRGFPGVSAVNLAGRQLGSPATRVAMQPIRTVILRTRATASATLRMVEAANYPPAKCRPATAAGLRVFPPGERRSRVVPYPFDACAAGGARYLSVGAVQLGTPSAAGPVIAPRH